MGKITLDADELDRAIHDLKRTRELIIHARPARAKKLAVVIFGVVIDEIEEAIQKGG